MVIQGFAEGVDARMKKEGFIEVLVPILMPLFAELIKNCLNNRAELEGYVCGRRNVLQKARLQFKARQAAIEAGVRFAQRGQFTRSLVNAIHAECDDCAGRMAGDMYDEALAEAAELVS